MQPYCVSKSKKFRLGTALNSSHHVGRQARWDASSYITYYHFPMDTLFPAHPSPENSRAIQAVQTETARYSHLGFSEPPPTLPPEPLAVDKMDACSWCGILWAVGDSCVGGGGSQHLFLLLPFAPASSGPEFRISQNLPPHPLHSWWALSGTHRKGPLWAPAPVSSHTSSLPWE